MASAIITSDTREKEVAVEVTINGKPVRIGSCCKGAGMISPCMATMICLVCTDAAVEREHLMPPCTRAWSIRSTASPLTAT